MLSLDLKSDLLALDSPDDLLRGILGDDLIIVKHLELLGGVTAHEVEDGLGATGVLIEPVGQVKDDTLHDNPEVILLVVLGNLLESEFLLRDGERLRGGLSSRSSSSSSSSSGRTGLSGDLTTSTPLDGDLTGGRGVDVEGNLAEAGSTAAALESLLEGVVAGRVTSNTAVDYATQKGRATETVSTVDATSKLTAGVETFEGLALLVENLGLVVDLNTTHGEVEHGLHHGDMEVVADVEGHIVEVLLAPRILLLALSDGIVGCEGLLEVLRSAADLLGELLAGHLLHETTARVVAGVEVEDVGGLGVEDEADGVLALILLLVDHAGDVITMAKLVAEAVTITVEEETTLTTEGLGGKELPLGPRVLGVDQTSRVDLNLVHVDAIAANLHDEFLTITSSVGAVGGGETHGVRAVLLEERTLAEIGSVTTSSKDNGALDGMNLAILLVLGTADSVALLDEVNNAGLLDDLDALGLRLGELLESLHQGVGDGHARELGIVATVGTGLRVTTETGDEGEVKVEDILEPLNGSGGLVGEDLDEVGPGLVTGRLESVIVELLH